MIRYFIFLMLLFVSSCATNNIDNPQELINKTIEKHGVNRLNTSALSFDFRDIHYELKKRKAQTIYSREIKKGDTLIKDVLTNGVLFERTINGSVTKLSDSLKGVYSNSLNSVMYFIQTPLVLLDKSVIKDYKGKTQIKGETYHVLKITFTEEGGGEDFEDEYRYWIHAIDFTIDYLGYNYQTSGGGTRFRQTFNRKTVKGVLFQDYINFKPQERFVKLDSLPILFEQQQLKKVSIIENKNIHLKLEVGQ